MAQLFIGQLELLISIKGISNPGIHSSQSWSTSADCLGQSLRNHVLFQWPVAQLCVDHVSGPHKVWVFFPKLATISEFCFQLPNFKQSILPALWQPASSATMVSGQISMDCKTRSPPSQRTKNDSSLLHKSPSLTREANPMAKAEVGTQLSQLQQMPESHSLTIICLLKPSTSAHPRTNAYAVQPSAYVNRWKWKQICSQRPQELKIVPYSSHPASREGDCSSRSQGRWQHYTTASCSHRTSKALYHCTQSPAGSVSQFATSHESLPRQIIAAQPPDCRPSAGPTSGPEQASRDVTTRRGAHCTAYNCLSHSSSAKRRRKTKLQRNVSSATNSMCRNAAADAIRKEPHVFSHRPPPDFARDDRRSNTVAAKNLYRTPRTTHSRCSHSASMSSDHFTRLRYRGCHSVPNRWCGR